MTTTNEQPSIRFLWVAFPHSTTLSYRQQQQQRLQLYIQFIWIHDYFLMLSHQWCAVLYGNNTNRVTFSIGLKMEQRGLYTAQLNC